MTTHKIKVKLGDAEFEAEGAEETVQAQYDQFLTALERTAQPTKPKLQTPAAGTQPSTESAGQLARIFELRQDGLVVFQFILLKQWIKPTFWRFCCSVIGAW